MADWQTQIPAGADPSSVHYWACSYLDADQESAAARRASALVDSDDETLNTWLSRYTANPDPAKDLVTLTRTSPASVLTFDCKANPLETVKPATSLPPIDPTPLDVVKVIDGDTLHVTSRGSSEVLKLRFVLINTPECRKGAGSSYERCPAILAGAEVGADEARIFLEQLVAEYGNIVYYRSFGKDSYGRSLSLVYVKDPAGQYIDVNLALVRAGRAHVYFIAPAETGFEEQYLAAQRNARAEGLGIWQLNRFKSPLVFSSFHGTSHNPDTAAEKEYLRLFNVSEKPMDLAGYQLKNGYQTYTLPSFVLPPGYGVKIYTHYGSTNDDTSQELSINLALGRACWDKDSPMLLMDRFGKTIAAHATNEEARKSLPHE